MSFPLSLTSPRIIIATLLHFISSRSYFGVYTIANYGRSQFATLFVLLSMGSLMRAECETPPSGVFDMKSTAILELV